MKQVARLAMVSEVQLPLILIPPAGFNPSQFSPTQAFLESEDIVIVRVKVGRSINTNIHAPTTPTDPTTTAATTTTIKDRFIEKPSPGGWRDLMINFYLARDPHRHVRIFTSNLI